MAVANGIYHLRALTRTIPLPNQPSAMNRSLKWGIGLLLLLGAAGAFFPISAFETAMRRQIAQQVRQVSGLDTDIKGRLSFSLLPRPQIRAENVAIGTQPSMALHTPFVRGNIRLLPLLGGRIELERLTLIGPQLSLHTATSSLTRPSAQLLGELSKLGPLTIAGGSLDLQIDGRPPVQISQVDGILDPREALVALALHRGAEQRRIDAAPRNEDPHEQADVEPVHARFHGNGLNLAIAFGEEPIDDLGY